jgi:hypothetical protein
MKKLLAATMLCMASWASGQDVMMQRTKGDVTVRHGVAETWNVVAAGDVLKPDDTIRTGKKGSAVLLVDKTKRIELPSNVIVDVSDIRELSQEELMLKLTMEKVRASSYEWKNDQMNIPNAPIVHGEDRTPTRPLTENELEVGKSEWNGTKVLYDNGYYPTSALKAMDVLRRYPPLGKSFENRLLIAEALERSDLRGEALNEYVTLSQSGTLTGNQKELVQSRIAQLRRQTDR